MNYECINGIYVRPGCRTFGYSDGDTVEDHLYAQMRAATDVSVGSAELAAAIRDWPSLYHLSPARADLLRPLEGLLRGEAGWVNKFSGGARRAGNPVRVLEIGSGCGAITRYIGELGCNVTSLEGSERRARITRERCRELDNVQVICDNFNEFVVEGGQFATERGKFAARGDGQFNVILLIGVLEYSRQFIEGDHPPLEMLRGARALLRPGGHLVVAIENKLGLKYWAGAPEDHTGRAFDGIEDRYDQHTAVTFGKEELGRLLHDGGFPAQEFLYPFPDYKLPEVILKEAAFQPGGPDLTNLLYEKFDYPHSGGRATEFSPTRAAAAVIGNGLMRDLSNSFLIVAGDELTPSDNTLAYIYNSARQKPFCKSNIVVRSGDDLKVIRQRLYPEASMSADQRLTHHVADEDYLPGRLLSTFVLDIVSRPGWGLDDLRVWAAKYYQVLSDHASNGRLPGRYLDLTPFNIIITPEGQARVFDQEWECAGDIPLHFIFFRGLVYTLDKIGDYALPAEGTPTGVTSLVAALVALFIPFDETHLQECRRLEETYFQSIPLRPGLAFGHGAISMRNTRSQQLEDKVAQTGAEMTAMQQRLEEMTRELNALKVQARQQVTRLQQDHQAHVALLHQQMEWYRRTYTERSIPGLLVQRQLDAARAGEKYLTSFLLTAVQEKGWGPTAGMIVKALSSKGMKGWLHPRDALLPLMRSAAGVQPEVSMLSWMRGEEDPTKALADIRNFSTQPLISLIMPVYNTDARWLQAAVDSIRHQWYDKWQLCIADDGSTSSATRQALEKIAKLKDTRILITRLEKNGGISHASNAAMAMATGEYIALMDHDDELTVDALYQVVKDLNQHGDADIFYTDECKVDEEGRLSDPFFKPAYSPELLLNMMYIGHLTIYKKEFLLNKVGGFREAYDLSQDYDLALRAVEQTDRIRHIGQMVYHWRMTAGSSSQGEKPHARITNLAALRDAMKRRNINAEVLELPTANRVRLSIDPAPLVSIIIPTDSADNLKDTLESICLRTGYKNFEIVVVTNSRLIADGYKLRATSYEPRVATDQSLEARSSQLEAPIYVPYDKPYNFSDKCNVGASHARGEILIFLNDDVRPLQEDWLDNTIEYLFLPGVGGVSPKLIYEDDTIQYAGMATGVRNLTGTTFHGYPKDSTAYINFPQSVRNVSILSGACLAVRKEVFLSVGGYDAVNTPSAHSDVDLSFKLMEAGYRLVYTPYATLRHIGHLSLKAYDETPAGRAKDKADIYLLHRWAARTAEDPYFTTNMRNYLYHDSPEPYALYPATSDEPRATSDELQAASHELRATSERSQATSCKLQATSGDSQLEARSSKLEATKDFLLVSHDLSLSGAPIMLLQLCRLLIRNGCFVTVICETDGPTGSMFTQAGASVIIDSLLLRQHDSLIRFARNFDHVICNTVVTWPVVQQLSPVTNTLWWLHEAKVIDLFVNEPGFKDTLTKARHVIAPSRYALQHVRKYNASAQKIYYGYPDISGRAGQTAPVNHAARTGQIDQTARTNQTGHTGQARHTGKLTISLFGSIEPRKGQDLLVKALHLLEGGRSSGADLSTQLEIQLVGRIHDHLYYQELVQSIGDSPYIKIIGECDHDQCLRLMKDCDIVVCPSRDDPFPVVLVEATCLSKPCIVSSHTGFAELITDGADGYVFENEDVQQLAKKIAGILLDPQQLTGVGLAARQLYEDHMTMAIFEEKFLSLLEEQPDAAATDTTLVKEKELSWQH